MKKLFCLVVAWVTLPAAAHESAVPHTHTFANQSSDLFLFAVAGSAALVLGCLLFRSFKSRRRLNASLAKGVDA
jgi:hypothetical protein